MNTSENNKIIKKLKKKKIRLKKIKKRIKVIKEGP